MTTVSQKIKRHSTKTWFPFLLLCFLFLHAVQPPSDTTRQEDAPYGNSPALFDSLRNKWKAVLVGGEMNTVDSDYVKAVRAIVADANTAWSSMLGVSDRE